MEAASNPVWNIKLKIFLKSIKAIITINLIELIIMKQQMKHSKIVLVAKT